MDPVVSEAISVLDRSPSVLRALLQELPTPWLERHEGEDTFGPREVLGHVIHGEKTDWVPRIKLILEHGDTQPFVPFDRRGFREAGRVSVVELLDEFETLRKANLGRSRPQSHRADPSGHEHAVSGGRRTVEAVPRNPEPLRAVIRAGKGRHVRQAGRRSTRIVLGILLCVPTGVGLANAKADTKSVEDAVLAVNAEVTRAGEAMDADRLFSYMLETDKGSVIQNGVVLATRQEALERVRSNLRGISKIQYHWKRQYVAVLSPQVALLTAEGDSVVTTAAGDTFTAPFAQTVVFVLKGGGWKAIHAHQSSPRVR